MDCKAEVKIGELSRGGVNRVTVKALDHDFDCEQKLTPVGIFVPKYDELTIYFVPSRATADCMVDVLDDFWKDNRCRFPKTTKILLTQDNGPENNSRRTQFIGRMVQFADDNKIDVQLAYYPPYHSKYNPVERCWGILEKAWNGNLLDSVKAVLEHASNMTWKGVSPVIRFIDKVYQKGKSLTKAAMKQLEATRLDRLEGLEPWFLHIARRPSAT